jgi:hypothetical protein
MKYDYVHFISVLHERRKTCTPIALFFISAVGYVLAPQPVRRERESKRKEKMK